MSMHHRCQCARLAECHAPLSIQSPASIGSSPDPSIVGGDVVDNNSGPDEETAEQNVAEVNEDNAEAESEDDVPPRAARAARRMFDGVMQLVDPLELDGTDIEKVLDGVYKNSYDITFNMVIRTDDPDAKEPNGQGYSLPTLSVRIDIFVYPPKAHVLGTFKNVGGTADRMLAPSESDVLSYLVRRGEAVSGREYDSNLLDFNDVDRFGIRGVEKISRVIGPVV